MTWPDRIVLVRHGESEGNILTGEERVKLDKATHDYALTAEGQRQTEVTAKFLKERFRDGFDAFYTSYYRRAKETMEILTDGKVKVYEDPRLREAERGIFHTYTPEEVEQYFPLENRRKEREGYYHYRPPGGENWPDIELRIHSFLSTLARDQAGKRVLIVVHGHWLILFQRMIHHFSIETAMDRYHNRVAPNASVTSYRAVMGGKLDLEMEHVAPWQT
jgi:probable phosphoglycerate mutase